MESSYLMRNRVIPAKLVPVKAGSRNPEVGSLTENWIPGLRPE